MLYNVSKQKVIAEKVLRATSFSTRLVGLWGKNSLEASTCLVLEPCNAIHTFFMRFAIDVLFLDRKGVVRHAIANLPLNRCSPKVKEAFYAVELQAGTIAATRTAVGDHCQFK